MFSSRPSLASWLWNHNPFYVISALLMLYGVRACYGEIDIGTIDCWAMTGVLAAYTLVLAGVGVVIIRWGKVWEDARSILLVLLLLFLAVSVSADDLFVKMESIRGAAVLMACGFGFSATVTLGVLYAAGIRLRLMYVLPLILFLALFFFAPWYCSTELDPERRLRLDWTLFLFPQIAAVLTLLLIPAARIGQKSVAGNGTPWPWPLFPWSAFVFIWLAVIVRSYALTMAFSISGPIWASPYSRSGIVFDTVWRPYFLVPLAAAILLLALEAGLAGGHRKLVRRCLAFAPGLLLLAWPWVPSEVMLEFLSSLVATIGSPVWLTVWMLIAIYGWATIHRAEYSITAMLLGILALSVVGPHTVSVETFTKINPLPLFAVSGSLAVISFRRRSPLASLAATALATAGLWLVLPAAWPSPIRAMLCYHFAIVACLLISVLAQGWVAHQLQIVITMVVFGTACAVLNLPPAEGVTWSIQLTYISAQAIVLAVCARMSHSRIYWAAFVSSLAVVLYAVSVEIYLGMARMVGRRALVAFSWSAGTLLIGTLISAHKARWIPSFGWLNWFGQPVAMAIDLPSEDPSTMDPQSDRRPADGPTGAP